MHVKYLDSNHLNKENSAMAIKTFTIKLKRAEMIAPQVRHLAFEREGGEAFTFIPGQFVTIHFECEGKTIKRSYSLATNPRQTKLLEFAVGHFPGGPGTKLLFHIKEGDTLTTSGPAGRLILGDTLPKRYIFVSTSTGVTPFRTMLPELEDALAKDLKVILLLGVQRREDLIYSQDFIDLAKRFANFEFRAHYSRETGSEAYEYDGYVQRAFPQLQLDPQNDIVYLCGNPGMIDEAFAYLKQHGFDTKSVRREKYISSK